MNALNKYVITVLFLCLAGVANAATNGCYKSGKMYYQTPVSGGTYFQGAAYYVALSSCTSQYYTIASGPSNSNCYADYDGSGSTTNSSNYDISGKKATFNLLTCPIDSYTLVLLALMASVGFFFLRRMGFNPLV